MILLITIMITASVMPDHTTLFLDECESLERWGSNCKLTDDAKQGKYAIMAEVAPGVSGAFLNYTDSEIDLAEQSMLVFWWKTEGSGLRNFMVKVRNYPIANGMEAVYPVWSAESGEPTDRWHRAKIILAEPKYDNWGGEPKRDIKYISFRTQSDEGSNVRLFLDGIEVLPPSISWRVTNGVIDGGEIEIQVENLTSHSLSIELGTGDRIIESAPIGPKVVERLKLSVEKIGVDPQEIAPFDSMAIPMWIGIEGLEVTRMEKTVTLIKSGDLPDHPRLLFNDDGIKNLKERIEQYDWAQARWNSIRRNADRYLGRDVKLPPRGGNWWHWYACPKHGAALKTGKQIGEWQWEHICPVDGEVLLGDPSRPDRDYDGCVISSRHGAWSRAVLDLGIVSQVTGDTRYAEKAKEILLAYAQRYLDYPLHTIQGEPKIGGGRVGPQTLDESTWIIPLCQGADLIWDTLTDQERNMIAEKMLLPAAKEVIMPHKMGVHNIQCWKNSAVGVIGFLLSDAELINDSIHNPRSGYWRQMEEGVLPDGIWWEGAWGYHFYTLSSLWALTEAAHNCGINLYCEELKSLFDGPIKFAMPNYHLPAFNDSGEVDLKRSASIYELAFARYGDPRYADLIGDSNRNNDFAFRFGAGELPADGSRSWRSANYPNSGYAILASGEGENATWFCMKYGPHGGGHGHPDKLNFVFYSGGEVIAPDPGTARYGVPIQRSWYRTTFAHNTLVVDESSQKAAEGECMSFLSTPETNAVMARAGQIGEGVDFVRSVLMIGSSSLVFVDQVVCDRSRTLDIVSHYVGEWLSRNDGQKWRTPDKPGYSHLRDAIRSKVNGEMNLLVKTPKGQQVNISMLADGETEVITGTGVGRHVEDRVPLAIFRRNRRETAFVWTVSVGVESPKIDSIPVSADGESVTPSSALALEVHVSGEKPMLAVINPNGLDLSIDLPNGKRLQTDSRFLCKTIGE